MVVMIIGLWLLNFVISIFNAWGCGKSWNETKAAGGVVHAMNWMGAIMSAAGFTWCYTIIMGFVATMIPIEQDDGTTAMLLQPESLAALLDLGYLVVIFPILGSGLAITCQSWYQFAKRRTLRSGGVAGYNTFAQVYNTYNAVSYVPEAFDNVGSFFKGSDSKNGQGLLVLILVAVALFGGVLTTYFILTRTAEATLRDRALEWEYMRV